MDFFTLSHDVAHWSAQARRKAHTVGFVPTMGALHEGHLDLVRRAREANGAVVCSIFVNPLQFNNPEDLARYPRQLERDREMLERAGCHALFAPVKEEIFAGHEPTLYDLGGLDKHWEGPSRPGHFQGVVNVVERLFFYVRPDQAFFGQKDRQQLAIISHVANALRWPEHIVPCPTVRSSDGLALSSRNQRLDPQQREAATVLYRALQAAAEQAFRSDLRSIHENVEAMLHAVPGVRLDHFGIAHPESLEPLLDWGDLQEAIALIAAQVGPVRLIDNITLQR